MRLVYMGTPEFAVPSLEALLDAGHEIVAVVTQPDKPVGRKRLLTPPPVKRAAQDRGIPILQPASARSPEFHARIRALEPKAIAYAAYGKILPRAFLDIPPLGCLNVHASLLPALRGAAPIQWAIMRGDSTTGVSIMRAEAGLDTGPVLIMRQEPIHDDDTAGTLTERLARLGAALLVEAMALIENGRPLWREQDEALATHAPMIRAETAEVDWTRPAVEIWRKVRGLNPKPGAVSQMGGRPVKLWRVAVTDDAGPPGDVIHIDPDGPVVATGSGALRLLEVQPAGSRRMTGADFARGLEGRAG